MLTVNKPLASWRFAGQLRHSQEVIIAATADQLGTGDPLHIVAPPGSGKTLLGLVLAMQQGDRALALAPTTTVRTQWARTAATLTSDERSYGAISEDPRALGDLTVLTYQMLSVLETGNPFDPLAKEQWTAELIEAGRHAEDAEKWLDDLETSNQKAYRAGILRRSRVVRKELTKQNPASIEAALHPNARELINRIVEHGITTILLDECHHLLDHWALVIRALVNRIESTGKTCTLIGLTATLPSKDDKEEYENYTGLLGEVDYELPTPAVVREANLAPYSNHVWFVTPEPDEIKFLRKQDRSLSELVTSTLASDDGKNFLLQTLLPTADSESADGSGSTGGWQEPGNLKELDLRYGQAFAKDTVIAEAATRFLWSQDKKQQVILRAPKQLHADPTTEQEIRLLARYALARILPDKERTAEWQKIKNVLADFGFHLTDKGIRRGRDPVDAILATTRAKEYAIGEIVSRELESASGHELRAVAICDFAVHGHTGGDSTMTAGALRAFETVVADTRLEVMHPVLVTGKHLRIATRDFEQLLPRLQEIFGGADVNIVDSQNGLTTELKFAGIGPAKTVRAVSRLMTDGVVRLIVGTRGLLGEGWDCPALNTLIDLTAVGTSSATQQLHGRTLRIDPQWSQKVAHNWIVTSLLDSSVKITGTSDVTRMYRKLDHVWGLSVASPGTIVKGIDHTLSHSQQVELYKILEADEKGSIAKLNGQTAELLQPRALTHAEWGVGQPYVGEVREEVSVAKPARSRSFGTPMTFSGIVMALFTLIGGAFLFAGDIVLKSGIASLNALLITFLLVLALIAFILRKDIATLVRGLRHTALPQRDYQGAALAVGTALRSRGVSHDFTKANVEVKPRYLFGTTRASEYDVSVRGLPQTEQKLVISNLSELFGPIHTPRFLIETGAVSGGNFVGWIASNLLSLFGRKNRFFAVPTLIGRRKADAETFADTWRKEVGPCRLIEIRGPADMVTLARARRQSPASDGESKRMSKREVWA